MKRDIIIAAVALVLSFGAGYKLKSLLVDAAHLAEMKRAEVARQAAEAKALALEEELQAKRWHDRTTLENVEKEIVTKTVYRDCVLPADGVRLRNSAIRAAR